MLKVTKKSPLTGQMNTLELPITRELYSRWLAGEGLIQDLMPDLSPSEREFLMTGYTDEDWRRIFPPGQDDDYPEEDYRSHDNPDDDIPF